MTVMAMIWIIISVILGCLLVFLVNRLNKIILAKAEYISLIETTIFSLNKYDQVQAAIHTEALRSIKANKDIEIW